MTATLLCRSGRPSVEPHKHRDQLQRRAGEDACHWVTLPSDSASPAFKSAESSSLFACTTITRIYKDEF